MHRRAATNASPTDIVTTYELRTGERFVRVHVELDHRVRDHRLRAHFPLPAPVDGSDAECAFAIVHRGLTAEGGPHEFGLPTFVSRRFVDCSAADDGGRRRPRARARRAARVRGRGRRAPSSRSRSSAPPATSPDRSRCCGPTRPVRSTASRARSCRPRSRSTTRSSCTAATRHAADLPAIADDVLVPLERVRGGGWPGAIGARARKRARRRRRRGVGAPARRPPVRSCCGW